MLPFLFEAWPCYTAGLYLPWNHLQHPPSWILLGGISMTLLVSLLVQLDVLTQWCKNKNVCGPFSRALLPWIVSTVVVLSFRLLALIGQAVSSDTYNQQMSYLKRLFGGWECGSTVGCSPGKRKASSIAFNQQRRSFYEFFFTNCQEIIFFWRHSPRVEFSSAPLQIPCRVCETANHNPLVKTHTGYLCSCLVQILQLFLDFCHILLYMVIWESLFIMCVLNEILKFQDHRM